MAGRRLNELSACEIAQGVATGAFSAEAVTSVRYCRFTRKAMGQLLEEFPKVEKLSLIHI